MNWYYADKAEQIGPLTEEAFTALARAGAVHSNTQVWGEGMPDWLTYGQAMEQFKQLPPPGVPGEDASSCFCAFCGKLYELDDVIRCSGNWICAGCKPEFVQRLREGIPLPGAVEYASFGHRLRAKVADNFCVALFSILMTMIIVYLGDQWFQKAGEKSDLLFFLFYIMPSLLALAYNTYFIGAYGATPGKMGLKLRVIRSDGSRVTYLRALCRHLAELLSSVVLLLGYLMALFDHEHRTLHDRICDTRVVLREKEM